MGFCAPTMAKEPNWLLASLLEVESFCSAEDLSPVELDGVVDVIAVAARAARAASPVRVTPLDT